MLYPLPSVRRRSRLAVLLERPARPGAVVHVRHQSKNGVQPSSTGYEIVSLLTPRAGETIIDKDCPMRAGTTSPSPGGEQPQNLIVSGFRPHVPWRRCARRDQGFMSTTPPTPWPHGTCPIPAAPRSAPISTGSRLPLFPTGRGSCPRPPDHLNCL